MKAAFLQTTFRNSSKPRASTQACFQMHCPGKSSTIPNSVLTPNRGQPLLGSSFLAGQQYEILIKIECVQFLKRNVFISWLFDTRVVKGDPRHA